MIPNQEELTAPACTTQGLRSTWYTLKFSLIASCNAAESPHQAKVRESVLTDCRKARLEGRASRACSAVKGGVKVDHAGGLTS